MSPTTRVLRVDHAEPDPAVLGVAADALREGQLVAFATETVYGLGARADDAAAVCSVFDAKGRPPTDPLIVHGPSADSLRPVVRDWPELADVLAEHFWPGPLTMVLRRTDAVAAEVGGGRDTVGVRVPAHPAALALLRAADVPVAAPSANRFGRISPTTAAHVLDELDGRVHVVLDAGPTTLGIESTVLDLTETVPRLLRPGGVTLEELRELVGAVHHDEHQVVAEHDAAAAPGQFLRHYAPSTPLVLVDGGAGLAHRLVGALATHGIEAERIELPADAAAAARDLYGALRRADAGAAALLLACVVPSEGVGRAVNDRLFRAAHGRVVLDDSPPTLQRLRSLLA